MSKFCLTPPSQRFELPQPDAFTTKASQLVGEGRNLVALGAPGSGKTTLAVSLVAQAVAQGRQAVLLSPTRVRADQLRTYLVQAQTQLASRQGQAASQSPQTQPSPAQTGPTADSGVPADKSGPAQAGPAASAQTYTQDAAGAAPAASVQVDTPRVFTPAAFALRILSQWFSQRLQPLPAPVLLMGADEDAALEQLIGQVSWSQPAEVTQTRGFRAQIRNLFSRCGELGVDYQLLEQLGQAAQVQLWCEAAPLLKLWDSQSDISAANRAMALKLDTARLQDRALYALEHWYQADVTAPPQLPDLVVVDDYQDCTAATARLLHALAALNLGEDERQGWSAGQMPSAGPGGATGVGEPGGVGVSSPSMGGPGGVGVSGPSTGGPGGMSDPSGAVEHRDGRSTQIVVLGNPDEAVETFRGGDPLMLASAARDFDAVALTLPQVHRGSRQIAALIELAVQQVQVAGCISQRRPNYQHLAQNSQSVCFKVAPDDTVQVGAVAAHMRSLHLEQGLAWGQMAVIVRQSSSVELIRQELRRGGVPLAPDTPALLLRSEPAAKALLDCARAALEQLLGVPVVQEEAARALLLSPLVGFSAIELRRLRRILGESPDHLSIRVLSDTELFDQLEAAPTLAAKAKVAQAINEALAKERSEGLEALVWGAWQASGKAQYWRQLALDLEADSLLRQRADHDLDVVISLFKRLEVWSERNPSAPGQQFLDELEAQQVASDSVASLGARPQGVSVLTVAACAGRQWEFVAVLGIDDGVWPNLRLRDSLTQTGLLTDIVSQRIADTVNLASLTASLDPQALAQARAQICSDEMRLLVAAMSRANSQLWLGAVNGGEQGPSSFFNYLSRQSAIPVEPIQPGGAYTLRGLVATLRRQLMLDLKHNNGTEAPQIAALLAALAQRGVPGADPRSWLGIAGASQFLTDLPAQLESQDRLGTQVATHAVVALKKLQAQRVNQARQRGARLSPSDVENIETCPLRWYLQRHGGSPASSSAQQIGALIHWLAQQGQEHGLSREQLLDLFYRERSSLQLPGGWYGRQENQRVEKMVENLALYLANSPANMQVEVECPVRAQVELEVDGAPLKIKISGRADRLEHTSQGIDVIDFKTGASVDSAGAQTNAQLATYRVALQARGENVHGGALIMLGKENKKAQVDALTYPGSRELAPSDYLETGQGWDTDLISAAARDSLGPSYQARTGEHCRHCAYQDFCPALSDRNYL
jgi:uvrD/REP helicase